MPWFAVIIEFIREKSHMIVTFVGKPLVNLAISWATWGYIPGRGHSNAIGLVAVKLILHSSQIWTITAKPILMLLKPGFVPIPIVPVDSPRIPILRSISEFIRMLELIVILWVAIIQRWERQISIRTERFILVRRDLAVKSAKRALHVRILSATLLDSTLIPIWTVKTQSTRL